MKKIPVILYTDIGGDIDDTWGLALLLSRPELDLKLVILIGAGALIVIAIVVVLFFKCSSKKTKKKGKKVVKKGIKKAVKGSKGKKK